LVEAPVAFAVIVIVVPLLLAVTPAPDWVKLVARFAAVVFILGFSWKLLFEPEQPVPPQPVDPVAVWTP
jgi:hypothetical protein